MAGRSIKIPSHPRARHTLLHRQDLTARANNSTHEEKSQEDLARITLFNTQNVTETRLGTLY